MKSILRLFLFFVLSTAVAFAESDRLYQRLGELDRDLRFEIQKTRTDLDDKGRPASRIDVLQTEFEDLESALHQRERQDLINKLEHLKGLLDHLKRLRETQSSSFLSAETDRLRPPVAAVSQGSPINDACLNATEVSLGETLFGTTTGATQDGTATCGASLDTADIWYRYVAPQSGIIAVDTIGSDFDTVLSVHASCPGTIANELRCDDDSGGLQSSLGFQAIAGEEYLIRVSGFDGLTGHVELHVDQGAQINGSVLDAENGLPLTNGQVRLYDQDGFLVDSKSVLSSHDGKFQFDQVEAGTYFARTFGFSGYSQELWQDIPCNACDVTSGAPIQVTSSSVVDQIDFRLDSAASISGVIVDAATQEPIPNVLVNVFRDYSHYDVYTDAFGRYSSDGLPSGEYYVWTESDLYEDRVWQDLPCAVDGYFCFETPGASAVEAEEGEQIEGIDFQLHPFGGISGTVTDLDGVPLPEIRVLVYDTQDYIVGSANTDSAGFWNLGGLLPGEYKVRTDDPVVEDEIWDDLPCCDLSTADLIAVQSGQTTSGVDFSLSTKGKISGTVLNHQGLPLSGAQVRLYDQEGEYIRLDYTDSTGLYEFTGVDSGHFFVATWTDNFMDEVWDDVVCNGGCDVVALGTSVSVALNTEISGIDFALERLGRISGKTIDRESGEEIPGVSIYIFDAQGEFVVETYTNSLGEWTATRLEPGTYYAIASTYWWAPQLYRDIECFPWCHDPTIGEPIEVSLSSTTPGVDFAMDRYAEFDGLVLDSWSGDAIRPAEVRVWSETGELLEGVPTNANGYYRMRVPPGSYYLTSHAEFYVDEAWSDRPCPEPCDPTVGDLLTVESGEIRNTIFDLALDGGAISGTVESPLTNAPVADATVEVFAEDGELVGSGQTDSFGLYLIRGLPQGIYHALARKTGWTTEIYFEVDCSENCAPTSGNQIAVIDGAVNENINFTLTGPGIVSGIVVVAETGIATNEEVYFYDSLGGFVSYAESSALDGYSMLLQPGVYYARVSKSGFQPELYDGVPCPSPCDETSGTPIVVVSGTTLSGIDFSLDRYGKISGLVVDEETQAPLADIRVEAWSSDNVFLSSTLSDADGSYSFRNLVSGNYYIATSEDEPYLDEVWNAVPCFRGPPIGCTADKGDPVEVVAGTETRHINFSLRRLESGIIGSVRDSGGSPLPFVAVDLWTESGFHTDVGFTDSLGNWALNADPGVYYVTTDNSDGWIDQIWQSFRCLEGSAYSGACDPTSGTQIVVPSTDPFVQGINFVLDRRIFSDGFEAGTLDAWTTSVP